MNQPLHIKYRPQVLEEVLGQNATLASLAATFKIEALQVLPHTFLFSGPSGTGKTTLARIVARMLGVSPDLQAGALVEQDAARWGGVEQMRALVDTMQFQGLGATTPRRMVIIDECHALSKAAWQPLLLATEEPPDHLFWALCTTEPDKVPKVIRTRARAYDLRPVKWDLLAEYMTAIATEEGLKVKAEFVDLAARKAGGSVRQALQYLAMLDGIIDKGMALQLLEDVDEAAEGPVALARMLVTGQKASWANAVKLLQQFKEDDVPPETIRQVVLQYVSNALIKTENGDGARNLLAVVQAFSEPCSSSDKYAPILLAVGGLMLGG